MHLFFKSLAKGLYGQSQWTNTPKRAPPKGDQPVERERDKS